MWLLNKSFVRESSSIFWKHKTFWMKHNDTIPLLELDLQKDALTITSVNNHILVLIREISSEVSFSAFRQSPIVYTKNVRYKSKFIYIFFQSNNSKSFGSYIDIDRRIWCVNCTFVYGYHNVPEPTICVVISHPVFNLRPNLLYKSNLII